MATIEIDGARIKHWSSFHLQCTQAFGFPATYANTMDAWVDCLSYLRDAENMTQFELKPNEQLAIIVINSALMREQAPDILEEMAFCIGGINERYEDYGEKPALELVLR